VLMMLAFSVSMRTCVQLASTLQSGAEFIIFVPGVGTQSLKTRK
jgi:hypothetical protein